MHKRSQVCSPPQPCSTTLLFHVPAHTYQKGHYAFKYTECSCPNVTRCPSGKWRVLQPFQSPKLPAIMVAELGLLQVTFGFYRDRSLVVGTIVLCHHPPCAEATNFILLRKTGKIKKPVWICENLIDVCFWAGCFTMALSKDDFVVRERGHMVGGTGTFFSEIH